MDFNNLSIMDGLLISIFSMLIVFAVLLAISYLVDITAFNSNFKPKKQIESSVEDPEPRLDLPEEGADSRTLAVIMAALSAMGGEESRFIIRKIESQEAPLSEWEAAGLRDNTHRRPS